MSNSNDPQALVAEAEQAGAALERVRAEIGKAVFGQERVIVAVTLADAIESATALVEESGEDGEGLSGSGIVITGSVVTAGAARTLFGRDPQ